MEARPRSNVPTSSGKPSQKSGDCYSGGGSNSILMAMILEGDVKQQVSAYCWACSVYRHWYYAGDNYVVELLYLKLAKWQKKDIVVFKGSYLYYIFYERQFNMWRSMTANYKMLNNTLLWIKDDI
jgi:hypothetical protein